MGSVHHGDTIWAVSVSILVSCEHMWSLVLLWLLLQPRRFFYNASSTSCQEFTYGGCNGNENRFLDIENCNQICKTPQNIETNSQKREEFTDFEDNFGGWVVYSWRRLFYDSSEAESHAIFTPPYNGVKINEVWKVRWWFSTNIKSNNWKVAIVPEHRLFDFRHPNLVQEFKIDPKSALLMEFLLLVKGSRNRGLFSFFFKLNAGLDVYFGNIKVFNFEQHGFNDEV